MLAVKRGEGAAGDTDVAELCGPVTRATVPTLKTTTDNVAALVAFTRALTWALYDKEACAAPVVVLRYSSQYAAMIASGAWRAKKHKGVAAEAVKAWARLRQARGDKLCMQHAPAGMRGSIVASRLAEAGKGGERRHGSGGGASSS